MRCGRPGVRAEPHRLQRAQQQNPEACHSLLRLPALRLRRGRTAEASEALSSALFSARSRRQRADAVQQRRLDDARRPSQPPPDGRLSNRRARRPPRLLREFGRWFGALQRFLFAGVYARNRKQVPNQERQSPHAPSAESPWGATARYTLPLLIPNCFQR